MFKIKVNVFFVCSGLLCIFIPNGIDAVESYSRDSRHRGVVELAPYQIRVNIIHPDCVYDTSVWTKKILRDRAKQYGISVENYKSRNLLKKSVHSMDVAEVVSFLASKEAAKTTGAQVPVDGGNDRII